MAVVVCCTLLVIIVWFDGRQRRIPHALTTVGTLFALLMAHHLPAVHWQISLLGGTAVVGLLATIRVVGRWWFGRPVLGFGDVMLGLFLGTIGGLVTGLQMVAVGMLLAGSYTLMGLTTNRLKRTDTLPYGVFLAMGGLLLLLKFSFV